MSARGLLDQQQLRAVAQLGAEDGYVLRLYDGFAHDARRALERMRRYAECGEAALLAREAHRLKGGSGSLGAAAFSRGCQAIERRARERGVAGLEGPIDEARRLLEATLAALRAGA